MFWLMIKINIILFGLLVNPVLLGMKRKNEIIKSKQQEKQKIYKFASPTEQTTIARRLESLDKFFTLSMPDIKEIMQKINSQPWPDVISASDKLLSFRENENRSHMDFIQIQRRAILGLLPVEVAKKKIKDEFKKIEDTLFNARALAQEDLITVYGIDCSSQQWQECYEEARAQALFVLQSMREPWEETTWDPEVPEKFAKALKEGLQERGFHQLAFNIKKLKDKYLILAGASCKSPHVERNLSDKKSFSYKKIFPACIEFNPNLAEVSDETILHIKEHELNHLDHGDCCAEMFLVGSINQCSNVCVEKIREHSLYLQFKLIQEILADVVSSLNKSAVAHASAKSHLYYGSYGPIVMAKTNWELLDLFAK
jgi:hypothetical protein